MEQLIINYDMMKKIKDIKEPYGPLKLIRNRKNVWLTIHFPTFLVVDTLLLHTPIDGNLPLTLGYQFGIITVIELISFKALGNDIFKDRAKKQLSFLSLELQNLDIKTNYDLLLESKQYSQEYHIEFNDGKLPSIVQSKYILVPTFEKDNNGNNKEESILQEHVIGSNIYTLSLGEPPKILKLIPKKV